MQFVSKPSKASSELFLRLPQEIYASFVDHQFSYGRGGRAYGSDVQELKSLRLAYRGFSYDPYLMEILFSEVRLLATPKHADSLEFFDFSHIMPYVRTLVFHPPHYSWPISPDEFRNVALPGLQKRRFDNDETQEVTPLDASKAKALALDAKFEERYKHYMKQASLSKALLQSQRLQDLWVKAIQAATKCDAVCISSPSLNVWDDFSPSWWSRRTRDDDSETGRCINYGYSSARVLGDALFETVLYCLSKASFQPETLILRFYTAGDIKWSSLPGWKELDFGKIWRLLVDLKVETSGCLEFEDQAVAEQNLDDLLIKCRESLQDLEIHGNCIKVWPAHQIIPLPNLHRLFLDFLDLHTENLAKLLPTLTALRDFGMCFTVSSSSYTWRPFFDAVRNNPRRLDLNWTSIGCKPATASAHYNTAEECSEPVIPDREYFEKYISDTLQSYLTGRGTWNRCMEFFDEYS